MINNKTSFGCMLAPFISMLLLVGCSKNSSTKIYSTQENEILLRETETGFFLERNGAHFMKCVFTEESTFVELWSSKGWSVVDVELKDEVDSVASIGYIDKVGEKHIYIKMSSDGSVAYRKELQLDITN